MNLTKMTRVSIFRNRRRFFLSFFLFLFLFLSLFSKRRRTVCQILYVQRWLVHRMTNRHGGIRSLASVYLWSDITAADRRAGESDLPLEMAFDRRVDCLESTIRAERLLLPFPVDLFFFFLPHLAPLALTLFLFFFAFLLFRGIDRCVTHELQILRSFVAIFIVLREILNSMIKIIASNNNLGAF